MSSAGRRNNAGKSSRRNRSQGEPTAPDFWRIPPKAAIPGRITPASDPTALLRSLGRPPLDHVGADRYLGTVAHRASGLATALAVAADILAEGDDD